MSICGEKFESVDGFGSIGFENVDDFWKKVCCGNLRKIEEVWEQ